MPLNSAKAQLELNPLYLREIMPNLGWPALCSLLNFVFPFYGLGIELCAH